MFIYRNNTKYLNIYKIFENREKIIFLKKYIKTNKK